MTEKLCCAGGHCLLRWPHPEDWGNITSDKLCGHHVPLIGCDEMVLYFHGVLKAHYLIVNMKENIKQVLTKGDSTK